MIAATFSLVLKVMILLDLSLWVYVREKPELKESFLLS